MDYSEKWPEITKNTPLEEVLEIHRRIWDEVIADPECKKPETPYLFDCAIMPVSDISVQTAMRPFVLWNGLVIKGALALCTAYLV